MRQQTIDLFQFDELDEDAKERARDWYREGALLDDWYESVYEDAARIMEVLGIRSQKPVKLMSGGTRYDPCIWFSGFSSQGDGACFEGSYSYAKGSRKAIREYAPQDTELHRIADTLADTQRRYFYRLSANVDHSGHYYHEGCTRIDVSYDGDDYRDIDGDDDDAIQEALRDFMRWIYRALEREHDYLMSDESVDESIRANEYEFDEDGNRA